MANPKKMVRIRERNQITLPSEVLSGSPLSVGDFVEVTKTASGVIELKPVQLVVAGTPEAEALERRAIERFDRGERQSFESADAFKRHIRERRRRRKSPAREAAAGAV